MTVEQIVKIRGIAECTLELFDYKTNEAMRPYATYTSLMDERELSATVYEVAEKYSGFEVVNCTIKAYVG